MPIQGTIFPGLWEFNVRGIYRGSRPQDDTTQFWLHKGYLDEKGPDYWKGMVGWYVVRVTNPDDALLVAKAVGVTPEILLAGMVFALLMGLVGGVPPAIRAARDPIASALGGL